MVEILAANWIWILVIGAFVAMHRAGGGCGMHGRGGHSERQQQHQHDGRIPETRSSRDHERTTGPDRATTERRPAQ